MGWWCVVDGGINSDVREGEECGIWTDDRDGAGRLRSEHLVHLDEQFLHHVD